MCFFFFCLRCLIAAQVVSSDIALVLFIGATEIKVGKRSVSAIPLVTQHAKIRLVKTHCRYVWNGTVFSDIVHERNITASRMYHNL